jgi:PAS domain S-box-containing protein
MKSTSVQLNKRKSGMFLMRLLLVMATSMLLVPPGFKGTLPIFGLVVAGIFLLSTLALLAVPAARLTSRRTDFFLVMADTCFVAIGLFHVATGQNELAIAFFVTLLLSALGRDILRIVVTSSIVAGFYLFLTHKTGMAEGITLSASLLRIPFLYVSALYYGTVVMRVRQDQERSVHMESERRDLESFLAVTAATTSSLHLQTVLSSIARKVGQMVGSARSSIILMADDGKRCVLMASNEKAEMDQVDLTLEDHPELKKVLVTRKTLLINDVANEPLMRPTKDELKETDFRAILVVPLIFDKEVLGMLSIRARKLEKLFSETDVKSCQVVANASANALKNALLYEQIQEEANRRKATSQVLTNIMDNFPDMIFMADLEGNFTDLNRGGEQMLGLSREKLIGHPVAAVFSGGELPFDEEKLAEEGGAVSGRQILIKAIDGALKPSIAAIAFLRDETGNPTGIVGVCKDLSELKKAQMQLQEAQGTSAIEGITELARQINQQIDGLHAAAEQMVNLGSNPIPLLFRERFLESAEACRNSIRKLQPGVRTQDFSDAQHGASTHKTPATPVGAGTVKISAAQLEEMGLVGAGKK